MKYFKYLIIMCILFMTGLIFGHEHKEVQVIWSQTISIRGIVQNISISKIIIEGKQYYLICQDNKPYFKLIPIN